MKLVRVLFGSDSDNWTLTQDALLIGSELWLVPSWHVLPDGQSMRPESAVRVDQLGFQESPNPDAGTELLLEQPLSTAIAGGDLELARASGFEVVEGPSDRFPPIPMLSIQ
jgi:hypothetical protein